MTNATTRVMTWNKIMCPVDFSPGSREALEKAVALAKESNAEVVVAYAWQAPIYISGEGMALAGDVVSDLIKDAEANLATWKADAEKLGARRVTTRLLTGAPWHEIVEAVAKDPAIDLIVMGTHGRSGIKHILLGSVAEKVVRHAPIPVLVIRSRK